MTQLSNLTIQKISQGLKSKEFSVVELTQCYLDTIAKKDNYFWEIIPLIR